MSGVYVASEESSVKDVFKVRHEVFRCDKPLAILPAYRRPVDVAEPFLPGLDAGRDHLAVDA